MKPIIKLINIPGFRYVQFFNKFGFGLANLVFGDANNKGKKLIFNFGQTEIGMYIGKGGNLVKGNENRQSPTASA